MAWGECFAGHLPFNLHSHLPDEHCRDLHSQMGGHCHAEGPVTCKSSHSQSEMEPGSDARLPGTKASVLTATPPYLLT